MVVLPVPHTFSTRLDCDKAIMHVFFLLCRAKKVVRMLIMALRRSSLSSLLDYFGFVSHFCCTILLLALYRNTLKDISVITLHALTPEVKLSIIIERHQIHTHPVPNDPLGSPLATATSEWETSDMFIPSGSSLAQTAIKKDLRNICTFPAAKRLEDTTCHICLNAFTESDEPTKLPCGHILGLACLTTWTTGRRYPTCPVCREPYLPSPLQGHHQTPSLDEINALITHADNLSRSIADEEQTLSTLNAQVSDLQRHLAQTIVQNHGLKRGMADLGERATHVSEGIEELDRGRLVQLTTNHDGAAFEAYRRFQAERYRGVPLTVGLGASPDLGRLIRRNSELLLAARRIARPPFRVGGNSWFGESIEMARLVLRRWDVRRERTIGLSDELPDTSLFTQALHHTLQRLADHRLNTGHLISIDDFMQSLDAKNQEVILADLHRWLEDIPPERIEDTRRWLYPSMGQRQPIFRLGDVWSDESMEMVRSMQRLVDEVQSRSDNTLNESR
ncbi:MAG: hypothetical protein Q9209_001104 [Squamulea sp. 1 TL-2023]